MRVRIRSLSTMHEGRGAYAAARTWLRDVRRRRGLEALRGLAGPSSSPAPSSREDQAAMRRLLCLLGGYG